MWVRKGQILSLAFAFIIVPNLLFALTFSLPKNGDGLVGAAQKITVTFGETAESLCKKYHVGFLELAAANPSYNLSKPLYWGWHLTIPTRYILPITPHKGIVVNVAELRLYYYLPDKDEVLIFPVGVGRKGEMTPVMSTVIKEKLEDPFWTPTKDARAELEKEGIVLPTKVKPGPDNPMGKFALRLGWPNYLIHGTNDPDGIGKRVTAGCLRMYPADIEELFHLVPLETSVKIVDQPFKAGWEGRHLYLEAHAPINDHHAYTEQELLKAMTTIVMPQAKKRHAEINWDKAMHVLEAQKGIPVAIGVERGQLKKV